MAKLTYEEYKILLETAKTGYFYELFQRLPMEMRQLYHECTDSDVFDELTEKYSHLSALSFHVMLGLISLKDLPTFIEKEEEVDRRAALHCAIKVCRHFLKQCSQYVDYIGNVDAYIEDWKDELNQG